MMNNTHTASSMAYAVDADTINIQLLEREGYAFFHMPHFSMPGHTRKGFTLDPCRKTAMDAAQCGREMITFARYMEVMQSRNACTDLGAGHTV